MYTVIGFKLIAYDSIKANQGVFLTSSRLECYQVQTVYKTCKLLLGSLIIDVCM